jgi:DNA-directed RNA polymerase specialized sigma24 family protein
MVDDGTLRLTTNSPEAEAVAGERLVDFEVFFDREKAGLFRALCLVTRNRFEAEELTQEAFLAVSSVGIASGRRRTRAAICIGPP